MQDGGGAGQHVGLLVAQVGEDGEESCSHGLAPLVEGALALPGDGDLPGPGVGGVGDATNPLALDERAHELRHGGLRDPALDGELAEAHRARRSERAEGAQQRWRLRVAGAAGGDSGEAVRGADDLDEDLADGTGARGVENDGIWHPPSI